MHFSPRDFTARLGGVATGSKTASVPAPGHPPHDRGLAIKCVDTAKRGYVLYSHNGHSNEECYAYVDAAMGITTQEAVPRSPAKPQRSKPEATDDSARIAAALRLWHDCSDIRGSLAEAYLQSRGLALPDSVIRGGALRFMEQCPFRLENGEPVYLPAMVAPLTDVHTAEIVGVHRTAINSDGSGKADIKGLGNPKKMLGRAKSTVIRLIEDAEVDIGLGLAEGIENGLAVLGTGWLPIWAAGTAGAMASFPVLSGIESLNLFADSGRAGEDAVAKCRARWLEAGREVRVLYPNNDSGDWNDCLRESSDG